MQYCVKCGTSIDGSWKHCPSCGSKVKNKDNEPIGNVSQDKADKTTSKKEGNFSPNRLEEKQDVVDPKVGEAKVYITIALVLLLFLIMIFMNGSSPSVNETIAQPSPNPTSPFLTDKSDFYASVTEFISAGCKPKIDKSYGVKRMIMPINNNDISHFPSDLAKNHPEMNEWGTSVDRALLFAAAYESGLAEISSHISLYSEMKNYRSKYNSYFNLADSIAKKLCTYTPTDAQLQFSETAISQLQNEYLNFALWLADAKSDGDAAAYHSSQSGVPQCDEIKTNNPNYNIVKCTNIP